MGADLIRKHSGSDLLGQADTSREWDKFGGFRKDEVVICNRCTEFLYAGWQTAIFKNNKIMVATGGLEPPTPAL